LDRTATLASAPVPTAAARHAAPDGIFRDPIRERQLIDFNRFQQESMADCVCELARAVRQTTRGRKLSLFFYGYVYEFGAIPTGPSSAGHYDLRRLLNSPDIDIVCSPISYFDRGMGQSAPCMSAAESVALAGKMWLNEDDTRTYLTKESTFPGAEHVVHSVEETNRELIRNVAQESTRNFATWWMDLARTGWFDDPAMWAAMKKLGKMDEPMLAHPVPFRPQVASVIDEHAMELVAEGGHTVTRPGIYEARAALGRMGAPYGQYLLDDATKGRIPARMLVFHNAWTLSAEQLSRLKQSTRDRVSVWCYAPGLFDSDLKSPAAMEKLTGFEMKELVGVQAMATPTAAGRKLGILKPFGITRSLRPLFAAANAKPEEILAVYPDGSAALALRRIGRGASLFVGPPVLTSELLRAAARIAGVHLYSQTDCCIYANGPFLALHAVEDGPLTIDTGAPGPIRDVMSGKTVGQGPKLMLSATRGDTHVFRFKSKAAF